jgi:hypothetical protein
MYQIEFGMSEYLPFKISGILRFLQYFSVMDQYCAKGFMTLLPSAYGQFITLSDVVFIIHANLVY